VNALQEFSRIEAGSIQAFYEPTDLPAVTAELAGFFRTVVEKAGLRFSIDCPPLAGPVYVDRAMWEKIVFNLLSNALKFTFEGEIAIALRPAGEYAELSVTDTGTGIPGHELSRIFDRFHRVEGARGRTYEGSGIGLALVQELAKLQGGSVRAESTFGRGSCFTVSILLGTAHLRADHVGRSKQSFTVGVSEYVEEALHWLSDTDEAASIAPQPSAPHGARARILLADDNADMRNYVQRVLAGSYEVQAVPDGEAALAAALKDPPDLVLTDITMPEIDGLELTQALRRNPRTSHIPVILLSARALEESRVERLEAGVDDYLIKPFSVGELLARVSSKLESAHLPLRYQGGEDPIDQITRLMPVVINVFDLQMGRDIYTSRDFATLIGYTREDARLMQTPISTLCHPDDLALYREHFACCESMTDSDTFEFQFRARHRDGRWRWLETRIMPLARNEQGGVCQVVTATIDVTARKHVNEALRASEERFRRYFELGLIGMAITSPNQGVLDVNDELCRILGYERAELLGKTWSEMTHPDDLAMDVANFERVMAGQFDGYTLDKRWIRKDGQVIDSTICVKCQRGDDGSVEYFVALLQDVTARKRAEEAVTRSNAELERRVAERTRQLSRVNEALRNQITERIRAEMESLMLGNELADELAAMTQLHEFSTRLLASTELKPLLQEVLNAIMSLQNADFGHIQLYNPDTGTLDVIVQRGLNQEFLDYFAHVNDDRAACGRAMHQGGRVIIEDVENDPGFAPHRPIAAASGFRAVQSTPLFSRRAALLGMMSTHFRQPHRPSERELRLTDLYAVHAAEMIERSQTETAVFRYQQELQQLTARLIEAQEMESKYLARELHDDFSQKLAVLGMEIAALAQRASAQDLSQRLLESTAQIGDLAKDIHRISRRLHPAILDDLGLGAALRNECIAFSEQYGIPVQFDLGDIPRVIPDEISLCCYRVAQECLRNVRKHANAREVRIVLGSDSDGIAMEVSDTGGGFDVETVKGKGGLGLISMEERVRLVNGAFVLQSQPGQGTVVKVCVPVRRTST
jgi:PAS domain S-box-containing protein